MLIGFLLREVAGSGGRWGSSRGEHVMGVCRDIGTASACGSRRPFNRRLRRPEPSTPRRALGPQANGTSLLPESWGGCSPGRAAQADVG